MTRPDPASPDSGANQDDAVWLDLVARLEGTPSTPDRNYATTEGPAGDSAAPAAEGPAGDSAAPTPFSAFDPLGLAGAAPIELSARERLGRPPEAAGTPGSGSIPGRDTGAEPPTASTGPRDYDADEDPFVPDEFVPEEPPSLAGADPMTVLAWLGAVGGPIALLMSAMFWRSAPLTAVLGMVAVFAASVVFLIMKLPGEKDEHDDGARL